MTNERKQYLKDANVSIPKRTKYHYKYKQESSQLLQASPSNQINNNYNNDNLINENDVIEQSSQVSAEIELHQNNNNNVIAEDEKEVEDDDEIEDEVENEETRNILLNHILENTELTKEELSAAYLSAFYSGSITQESLTTFLQLHNIHSPIKIPTSFSNLTKILSKNVNFYFII